MIMDKGAFSSIATVITNVLINNSLLLLLNVDKHAKSFDCTALRVWKTPHISQCNNLMEHSSTSALNSI